MNEPKLNIICLSNQMWNFVIPTNKKHVMSRLEKMGHNVLYVDPPINIGRLFLRQIKRMEWSLLRLLTQTYKDGNALVYTPLNFTPDGNNTSKMHVERINKLTKGFFDPNLKTVLWVYHVETIGLANYIDNIPHDILIYDCVDNYSAFPENKNFYPTVIPKKDLPAQEEYLTKKADLVFATAPGLVEKLKQYRSEVYFMPNVGDYPRFVKVDEYKNNLPEDLKDIRRPRIGFAGSVDSYKFDIPLVKKIAQDYPNYSFVIIGPLGLKDRETNIEELGFSNLKNVHFLGVKPFEQIVKYYAGFDSYIIPTPLNDYTVGGCFPVKFHEALAAGLPTVVTNLPAYEPFSYVSYISRSNEEFSTNVKRSLMEDSAEKRKARQSVAKENNWDGKVNKMLGLVYSLIS